MNTQESNKLIAVFMGADPETMDEDGFEFPEAPFTSKPNQRYFAWDGLKYHESWDWLMQVVDKINHTGKAGGIL